MNTYLCQNAYSKAPPKRCFFSISPASKTVLLVVLYKFLLID